MLLTELLFVSQNMLFRKFTFFRKLHDSLSVPGKRRKGAKKTKRSSLLTGSAFPGKIEC
jgi:hypothetical protein